jgi:hypothetical protein
MPAPAHMPWCPASRAPAQARQHGRRRSPQQAPFSKRGRRRGCVRCTAYGGALLCFSIRSRSLVPRRGRGVRRVGVTQLRSSIQSIDPIDRMPLMFLLLACSTTELRPSMQVSQVPLRILQCSAAMLKVCPLAFKTDACLHCVGFALPAEGVRILRADGGDSAAVVPITKKYFCSVSVTIT